MVDRYSVSDPLTDRELEILRLKVKRHSNQEIADTIHLSRNTVRWYVSQIYSKLHVTNRTQLRQRAEELGLLADRPPSPQPINNNLPNYLTSFIGREPEIAELIERLKTTRLLTLSGAGGTGKTRLALKIADAIQADFRDGVFFVDLAPLTDGMTVANAIADVLGVVENADEPIEESLKRALQNRHSLLILDNFEHVLSGAQLVSELLQVTLELSILVTSREALHLYGEHEFSVQPLHLPDDTQQLTLKQLSQFEAIQLFAQRATAVSKTFQINADNIVTISQICKQLDGLPLAIELAAARIKLLPLRALLSRLDNRLDMLSSGARDLPERQQTIRNTIAWSYDLLTDDEKSLFARLSVFRGGRSLEACEIVCADGLNINVFDGLTSLIDKNLLVQREDNLSEPRFWMMETIQEFAFEQLAFSNECDVILGKHASYFMHLAEQAMPELLKAQQVQWIEKIENEHNNIRSALRRSLDGAEPELGMRIVIAMCEFWYMMMHHLEAEYWINIALKYVNDVAIAYAGRLFVYTGYFRWRMYRDHLACRQYSERAYQIGQQIDDKWLMAFALRYMSGAVIGRPKELEGKLPLEEAYHYSQLSIELWTELGELAELAHSMNQLASLLDFNGQLTEAKQVYEECVEIARKAQDIRRIGWILLNLASIERQFQNHKQATNYAREAIIITQKVKDMPTLVACLINIENPQFAPLRTARLLSASNAIMESIALIRVPTVENTFQNTLVQVKKYLDAESFVIAWEEGSRMSLDQAVAYALDETHDA